jgi:regulator of protease activity HflC (stomatin/prohibitin superfamily)
MSWGRTREQQHWVDEANAAEEERARRKAELKSEDRARDDLLRAELQREIATLRAEMVQRSETMLAAAGEALGDISNKILDRVEAAVNRLEGDLARKFGEALGRIDALAPGAREKDFKFANERDDERGIVDLPNPLTPLVRKVTMN